MVQQLLSVKLLPQWIAAAGVTLVLSQMGMMCGWTSPYLAKLTTGGDAFLMDMDEASWVASLLNVGRFFGAIIGAICVNYWGSKKALIHTLVPMTLSWVLMVVAKNAEILYVARVFGGMGLGMAFSCFPLYIGEIALPQIRGAIVTIAFCGSPFGNVIASVVGPYLTMQMSAIVFIVPCLLDIALFVWLPDSPHHLMKIGDEEGARKAIDWYRSGERVDEEFKEVQRFVSSSDTLKDKLKDFKRRPIRMAVFISTVLFIYMQIGGLNSILFYQEIIFRNGRSKLIDPSTSVIVVSICGAITSLLTINLMDKCGRKMLLIISGLGMTISMLMLGTHFKLMDLGFDPTKFQWLPVASVLLFMVSFVFGIMPVPSAVLSELFPANIKCIAACMASLAAALFAFGVFLGVSISLVMLGTHFILLNNKVDWIGDQWLPVVSLFLFITSFVAGLNTIPSIVSSEVYAANVKSVAACFANLTAAGAAFIASKSYQPLVDLFGEAYVFYAHAFITFMAVPYAILVMPETKGKSLQQIQDDLMKK